MKWKIFQPDKLYIEFNMAKIDSRSVIEIIDPERPFSSIFMFFAKTLSRWKEAIYSKNDHRNNIYHNVNMTEIGNMPEIISLLFVVIIALEG